MPSFASDDTGRGPLFWEHEGNAAVRVGKWKLVRKFPGPWELYDMEADRTEMNDLAAQHPDKRPRDDRALPELGRPLRRYPSGENLGVDGGTGRDSVLGRREAEVAAGTMTGEDPHCCARREIGEPAPLASTMAITPSAMPIARRWSPMIGGSFLMGSNDRRFPDDGEGPVRRVQLNAFSIACYTVSNLQFAEFVRKTGYTTEAERYGWSFVFEGLLSDEQKRTPASHASETPWWVAVPHAYWAQPEGPLSNTPRSERSSGRACLLE